MDEEYIHNLIGKSLTREINKNEKEELESWLSFSEENTEKYDQIKDLWQNTNIQFNYAHNQEEVFNRILVEIEQDLPHGKSVGIDLHPKKRKNNYWKFSAVAASILILLVSVYWGLEKSKQREISVTQVIGIKEKRNLAGEKSIITLRDGTKVTLNSGSTLRYPEIFGDTRSVVLEGEAYFDVAKDTSKPFIVISDVFKTIALGTAFNIRAFPEDNELKISLAEGKVLLEKSIRNKECISACKSIVLNPGEEIRYIKEEKAVVKQKFDPEEILAWKDGILVFRNKSLKEIIPVLERWYAVKFEIKNSTNTSGKISDQFQNESLEIVMEGIAFAFGFKYKIEDRKVIIN
ncbi:FecR family protein [Flexithrix dorotheae]|uniref:FecR family protein n=1 Tax=Flexithrix dorotheae TaxID=70993 RepID=UPI00036D2A32|nr:FecR family protein [Flexithrix dorotheae]